MPVRASARSAMVTRRLGVQTYNGHTGRCQSMPTSQLVEALIEADTEFVAIVQQINWNRVLLQASARHNRLKRLARSGGAEHRDGGYGDTGICGTCLMEAMLLLDSCSAGWVEDAPRVDPDLARELAEWREDEALNPWSPDMDFQPSGRRGAPGRARAGKDT